jgi:hypothetical protein
VSHFIYYIAECHYAECHFAECRYAKCHFFRGGATFEMRELNTEKCIFRLINIAAAQRLINGRR